MEPAPLPLSVFIITLNEADRLAAAMASVKGLAAEIIVIDSGSTDGTVTLAESLGARVLFHAWPGYGEQKRFGEEQCRHDWLLNLDADERLTPELAEEIRRLFRNGEPACAAYAIDVRDLLPGETRPSRFAHSNRVLRLYDKRRARFSPSPVHDSVQVREGGAGVLRAPALHYSFRSIAHAVDKFNRYTDMQAEDMRARGVRVKRGRLYTVFFVSFLKAYLLRGYAMRGRAGFVYSMIYGFNRFLRLAKYEEKPG